MDPCHPIKAPPRDPTFVCTHICLYWFLSVFYSQEKAIWKSRPGFSLILSLYFDSVRVHL